MAGDLVQHPYRHRGALMLSEVAPGAVVVVIAGGAYHHMMHVICSVPYVKKYLAPNPDPRGVPELIGKEAIALQARCLGHAAKTELSEIGEGAGISAHEHFAADWGLCPDPERGWSGNYVVSATNYRVGEHY